MKHLPGFALGLLLAACAGGAPGSGGAGGAADGDGGAAGMTDGAGGRGGAGDGGASAAGGDAGGPSATGGAGEGAAGGGRASGGAGGGTAGSGGPAATGGAGGSGGGAGMPAGGSSGGAGGRGGSAGMPGTGARYACTQFMGPNVTGEWFAAGFENHVDGARWQVKAPHRSFVEDWADPNHDVWRESNCRGTFYDCETKSRCPGVAHPDRVIFVTQTGNYLGTTQATWEAQITRAIDTIKAKYPGLRHVQLMTFIRSPDGQNCGNETTVSPSLDRAHQALAARSNGFISVAPPFKVPACSAFGGVPHLTAQGNRTMAEIIGRHYAAEAAGN